jgi:outer membrane autotransporter protein
MFFIFNLNTRSSGEGISLLNYVNSLVECDRCFGSVSREFGPQKKVAVTCSMTNAYLTVAQFPHTTVHSQRDRCFGFIFKKDSPMSEHRSVLRAVTFGVVGLVVCLAATEARAQLCLGLCGGGPTATPSQSNQNVDNILKGLSGTTDPQLAQVVANVNGAANSAALNNILSTVQPEVDRGAFETVYQFDDAVLDATNGRLNSSGASATDLGGSRVSTRDGTETGMAAGDIAGGRSGWGQVFGQTARQTAGAGNTGFNANTAGFAMGADTDRLIPHGVVGVAIGYGNSFVSAKDGQENQVTIDSYQLSFYGDYDFGSHNFLRGTAAYGFDTDGNTRHNVGGVTGLTAKGSYTADEYSLELRVGHHFTSDNAVLTPGLMARYLGYQAGSYTESGAGGADLNVSQRFLNVLELGPTAEAAWNYSMPDGSRFEPTVHAGYRYDLVGDSIATTSFFTGGGGSFETLGTRPGRSRFDVGVEASLFTSDAWNFRAAYDLDLRQDYVANSAILNAAYRF